MQSPSRRNMFHIELDCAVPMSPLLLPCSGVHHRAGVRGRQPADPAGGAAVQRAGLDVLALRRCPAAPWPGLPLLWCRVHVQRRPSPGSALVIYGASAPVCCKHRLKSWLSPATVLYFFERCYESGGRLFERIFSQMVFTLFIFEAFTGV